MRDIAARTEASVLAPCNGSLMCVKRCKWTNRWLWKADMPLCTLGPISPAQMYHVTATQSAAQQRLAE